jgi:hypothetical protein
MIIGIVGFAGSGKGTVADILVDQHDFIKISFADAVKDATSAIFGWPRRLLEGDTNDSRQFRETDDDFWSARIGRDFTPRLAMQLMGTEAGREVFHQNLWIDVVERKIKYRRAQEVQDRFVIPDVRFPNEIEAIRRWGGFVVRILRGKEPEWYEVAERANRENNKDIMIHHNVHYSEWAWIGQQFNYLISNNGTISMLEADIKHMLRVMTGPDIINQVVRN